MKKLLAVVAGSAPYTPNLSKTGSDLFITDARTLLKYLNFLVNDSLVFEIGGRNKKPNQTKYIENAWMCLDDIETGFAKTIPLWLFGFLY